MHLTKAIVNAIIAGIGSDDRPVEQMLSIADNLEAAGYVIAARLPDREGLAKIIYEHVFAWNDGKLDGAEAAADAILARMSNCEQQVGESGK